MGLPRGGGSGGPKRRPKRTPFLDPKKGPKVGFWGFWGSQKWVGTWRPFLGLFLALQTHPLGVSPYKVARPRFGGVPRTDPFWDNPAGSADLWGVQKGLFGVKKGPFWPLLTPFLTSWRPPGGIKQGSNGARSGSGGLQEAQKDPFLTPF